MKTILCKKMLSCLMLCCATSAAQSQVIKGNAGNLNAVSLANKDILYFWHDSIRGIAGRTDSTGNAIWVDTIVHVKRVINKILTFDNGSKHVLQSWVPFYGTTDTNITHFSIIDGQGNNYLTRADTIKTAFLFEILPRNDTSFYVVTQKLVNYVSVTALTLNNDTIFSYDSLSSYGIVPSHPVSLPGGDLLIIGIGGNSLLLRKMGTDGQTKWEKNVSSSILNFDNEYITYMKAVDSNIFITVSGSNNQSSYEYNLFFLLDSAGSIIKEASYLLRPDNINQSDDHYEHRRTMHNDSLIYLHTKHSNQEEYRLFTFDLSFQQLCDMAVPKMTGRFLGIFDSAYETKDTTINSVKHTVFSPLICTEVSDTLAVREETFFEKEVIYPNPSNGLYHYEIHLNPAFKNENLTINILDFNGKTVYSQKPPSYQNVVTGQLNLENIPDGIYLYSISNAKGRQLTKHLVKIGEK